MQVKIITAGDSTELETKVNEWLKQVNSKVLGIDYHTLQRTDMNSTAVFSVLITFEK